MKRRATPALLAGAVSLAAKAAHAYRPFDSTDAAVAERGGIELEIGPVGYVATGATRRFAPLEVVNLGLASGWELVLQGREVLPPDAPGASPRIGLVDTGAFLKGVVREGALQGKSGPSVALEIGPLLPTVHDERGAGFSAALILSHRLPLGAVHLNVQEARTRAGRGDLFVGLIVEGPQGWRVRPVAELYAEKELGARATFSALGGAIVPIAHGLALDSALRAASIDGVGVYEVRAGFTWAIALWE